MKTLWLSLLLSSVIWAEEDYFLISPDATWNGTGLHQYNTTWDEARNHCQACFKELTTITSRNVHLIVQNLSLDYWTGLRRSYNGTIPWSRWSNGDPVTYQNWYPGHPLPNKVKKMIPKCFSTTQSPLSTIITATTSTPVTSTQTSTQTSTVTSPATQNSTKANNTDMCPFLYDILNCFNVTCDDLELKVQNYFGFTPKTTTYSTTPNPTTHSTIFTTTGSGTMNTMINSTTTESTTTSNCVFEPEPDPEVYIEDACVVLLSFGMWKEKICNETLPFICYDVRFFGQIDISNVNTHEGNLSWSNPPGNITHYRVEITGNPTKQTSNETALYKQLQGLIPGNLYKVQVFPVKCGRDLNPQYISFYTKPSGVEDLTVVSVTTVSVSLKWSKPVGGRDFYSVHFTNMSDNSKGNKSCPSEECTITDLIPGNEYVFTVSAIVNKTTEGVPMSVSNYTIPSKVTGLTSEDNLSTAIKASWNAPFGNHSSYRYCLKVQNNKECTDCNITTNSEITTDCNNTANSTNTTHCNITTNSNITTDCNITKANSITLLNKIDGTKYCLCVAALTDGGKLSGEMVVIPAYTEPKTVILSLAPDSQNITASWTIDGNYERFNVTITTVHDQIIKENIITANLSYTFKNLKAGVQYNVSVITLNGVLRSDTVNSLAYTYPLSPEWAKATSYKTSINVTWGPPKESKEAVILYKVDYYTAFWKEHNTIYTNNTEFTFYELKSGTRYEFNVSVVAGNNTSLPVKAQAHTEPVKETLILTMLCSSQTPLHCEEDGTQDDLLAEMNTRFLKQFGDNVHWKLKWVERSP